MRGVDRELAQSTRQLVLRTTSERQSKSCEDGGDRQAFRHERLQTDLRDCIDLRALTGSAKV